MDWPDRCKFEMKKMVNTQDAVIRLESAKKSALKSLKEADASAASIRAVTGAFDAELARLKGDQEKARKAMMDCWKRTMPVV